MGWYCGICRFGHVRLEDSGVITLCKITTFEPEPELDFDFNSTPSVQRVIMKSEWLRDAFNELDSTSDRVTFLISPERPFFRLSSFGVAGSTEMDYPKDTDVLESFYCTAIAQHSYRFSLIQHCLKALNASKKSSIRTNERGFMSMQFMIPTTDTLTSFVTFLFSPLETDLNDGRRDEEDD
ncbi:cell cycle checkpoint protein RAD1-like protein [Jimgerdemannia flammicorona]|uniref:Cell cycle checkpoint protein RAD1-like protein n=1 Tax=Jimgerdemannia flammicorona TaxID=994334 RepID=A0A433QM09_9FUNG|nr:cell cycle checkpoint protein RAD1-like protein [Jimgerdemannia flammicorona]